MIGSGLPFSVNVGHLLIKIEENIGRYKVRVIDPNIRNSKDRILVEKEYQDLRIAVANFNKWMAPDHKYKIMIERDIKVEEKIT